MDSVHVYILCCLSSKWINSYIFIVTKYFYQETCETSWPRITPADDNGFICLKPRQRIIKSSLQVTYQQGIKIVPYLYNCYLLMPSDNFLASLNNRIFMKKLLWFACNHDRKSIRPKKYMCCVLGQMTAPANYSRPYRL